MVILRHVECGTIKNLIDPFHFEIYLFSDLLRSPAIGNLW